MDTENTQVGVIAGLSMEEFDRVYGAMITRLAELKYREIVSLNPVPALDFKDTIIVVTSTNVTGKASVDQLMQYLNENLRNFICWKPVVNNKTLAWERSSNDEAPQPIDFADIMFPMASDTEDGMITAEMFTKIGKIDEDKIVYDDDLSEAIETRAPSSHTHEQYQLKAEMPTTLSAFENDEGFITISAVPTKLSELENDAGYYNEENVPFVTVNKAGFMTPDILQQLNFIFEHFTTQEDLVDLVKQISNNIPKKVSEFENDAEYVSADKIAAAIGAIGAVNLIDNSDFRFGTESWLSNNAVFEEYWDDPDYPSAGKVTFDTQGILYQNLAYGLTDYQTVSFMAKAQDIAHLRVEVGNSYEELEIQTTWRRYTVTIKHDPTDMLSRLSFRYVDSGTCWFLFGPIQIEHGQLRTEWFPSWNDIFKSCTTPATDSMFGTVRPDNRTIVVDENGNLKVNPTPETTGVQIDDDHVSRDTTYSSNQTEVPLATKAPLVDGLVPSDYLPGFLDDVIEGEMVIEEDGTQVFVCAEYQRDYGPQKGKLYLDIVSNRTYRWSGSAYVPCTTDKLAGNVLVEYNAQDKFMYFKFPST